MSILVVLRPLVSFPCIFPHYRIPQDLFISFLCLIQDDKDLYEEIISTSSGDLLFKVKRNSEVLGSLTRDRAPPPKNRRRPSLKKRHGTSEIFSNSEEELDKVSPPVQYINICHTVVHCISSIKSEKR